MKKGFLIILLALTPLCVLADNCQWDENVHEKTLDFRTKGSFSIDDSGNMINRFAIHEEGTGDDGETYTCNFDSKDPNFQVVAQIQDDGSIEFIIPNGSNVGVDASFTLSKTGNVYHIEADNALGEKFCSHAGAFSPDIWLTKAKPNCKVGFR